MSKALIIILVIVIILIIVGIGIYSGIIPITPEPGQKPGVQNQQTNPTTYDIQGMKVEILQQGTGAAAKSGDKVTVNYVGTLQDGTKFDSSIDRGTPFQFTLGQNSVIQGWELGVTGMKIGEKRKLTIPPELAYGAQGVGSTIPPNATLTFEVDLLGINQ